MPYTVGEEALSQRIEAGRRRARFEPAWKVHPEGALRGPLGAMA